MTKTSRFLMGIFCFMMLLVGESCNRRVGGANSDTRLGTEVVRNARKYNGTPYQYAGLTKDGLDCSGLVFMAYKDAGKKVPRGTSELVLAIKKLNIRDVRAGDLLFFKTDKKDNNRISHVGIVIKKEGRDDVLFIHAANSGVREDKLSQQYYKDSFAYAGRL